MMSLKNFLLFNLLSIGVSFGALAGSAFPPKGEILKDCDEYLRNSLEMVATKSGAEEHNIVKVLRNLSVIREEEFEDRKKVYFEDLFVSSVVDMIFEESKVYVADSSAKTVKEIDHSYRFYLEQKNKRSTLKFSMKLVKFVNDRGIRRLVFSTGKLVGVDQLLDRSFSELEVELIPVIERGYWILTVTADGQRMTKFLRVSEEDVSHSILKVSP